MAAYGTLVAWAEAMGQTEAAKLLQQTLEEEKAADKKLSGLAEGGINQRAAEAAHPHKDDEEQEWGQALALAGRVRPLRKRAVASGTVVERVMVFIQRLLPTTAVGRQR